MRQPSEVREELAAIDATLAGDAVDPAHAELAELALLLVDERPELDGSEAARLDARVAAVPRRERARRRQWHARWRPAVAGVAVVASAAVAVVVATSGGGNRQVAQELSSKVTAVPAISAGASSGAALSAPAPGRAVVQSAQLTLNANPRGIDGVANEVYSAVGTSGGYVLSSSVTQTGGLDGSARFTLSLPSSGLAQSMAHLSRLPGSSVASRTDSTQDVTDRLSQERRRLADARALRTALLHELSAATTAGQIASLRGRLHDAEAAIDSAASTVQRTEHQVAFSNVTVSIQATSPPAAAVHHRTPVERALHVLGSIGGALLLALVILVPVALLLGVLLWGGLRGRRTWRERGL
jgi:hypothetical protein